MTEFGVFQAGRGPGPAAAAGAAAGLVTLGLVLVIVWILGGSGEPADRDVAIGDLVEPSDLDGGECLRFAEPDRQLVLAGCSTPHAAQVTARLPYTGSTNEYPGADELREWLGDQCITAANDFLGDHVLSTSLEPDSTLPNFGGWSSGDRSATCYVGSVDGSPLVGTAEGRAADFPRGSTVRVFRLQENDCFIPSGDVGAYDLNSNSEVELVSCEETYNGLFFGRERLDFPIGDAYPGDDAISEETRSLCGELFASSFGAPSEGFNYRYWRPNEQSWAGGDRNILCAVLDDESLEGVFSPSSFQVFFDIGAGSCFDLGPSEVFASLRLDDRVLPTPCSGLHQGQMVGGGLLAADDLGNTPSTNRIESEATTSCEAALEDLIGRTPEDSEIGNFRVWYPTTDGWVEGERRYACAFLDDVPVTGSILSTEG